MNLRRNTSIPRDLLVLLQPFSSIGIVLCFVVSLIPPLSPGAWFAALSVAATLSLCGTLLLFAAKLPQYRAGIFWRFGSRRLPLFQQKLYRAAYCLIIPGCAALLLLLLLGLRVR